MNLLAALKLVFSESSFLKSELEHVEAKRLAGEAYQPAKEFEPEARSRIRAKRWNLLRSFSWILGLVLAGTLAAQFINEYRQLTWFWVKVIRAISIVLLAWAVWSKLGDIETFKGQTLLELTSKYLYKLLYSVGLFLGALALFLEGTSDA